jgi:hypothetical protein
MDFSILAAHLDDTTWTHCKGNIQQVLSRVPTSYVEIGYGIWVLKTKECYSAIHDLTSFFKRIGVSFVLIPLSAPLHCGLPRNQTEALATLGVEFRNIFD